MVQSFHLLPAKTALGGDGGGGGVGRLGGDVKFNELSRRTAWKATVVRTYSMNKKANEQIASNTAKKARSYPGPPWHQFHLIVHNGKNLQIVQGSVCGNQTLQFDHTANQKNKMHEWNMQSSVRM